MVSLRTVKSGKESQQLLSAAAGVADGVQDPWNSPQQQAGRAQYCQALLLSV